MDEWGNLEWLANYRLRRLQRDYSRKLLEKSGREKKCALCGVKNVWLTCDHIKELSQGGSVELENLQWLCAKCHFRGGKRKMI
jgi:5-methylcytosine-specific restriction endonuclease McrA